MRMIVGKPDITSKYLQGLPALPQQIYELTLRADSLSADEQARLSEIIKNRALSVRRRRKEFGLDHQDKTWKW